MIWRLLVLVFGLISAGLAAGCERHESEGPRAVVAAPEGILVIEEREVPDYKAVAAVLTHRDVGDARARIGGVLQQLTVREGEQVRRGQLVAVIVDQRLSLEAQAGAAGVAAAEAGAVRARADLQRVQFLFERGVYAQARMDAAQAEATAAEAQLRAARAQAGAMGAAANQGRVYAPADGRVTRAPIPQGAVVMPGDVVVAISTGARVLRIELPEAEANLLREGQDIRLLDESGGAPRVARVRQVYPAIDNGMVMADLDAAGLDGSFVGARVRVLAPAGIRRAFVIPQTFLVTRYGIDYVRLWRDGDVIEAPVQRGASVPTDTMPDGIEILSGLRAGDSILPPESDV